MAVGDDAKAAGYALVPDTGSDDARVRHGAREINKTRDYIARVLKLIPVSKAAYRAAAGITSGAGEPTGGDDGDIYLKIL